MKQLSDHFTLEELTTTDQKDLLEANKREAATFEGSLKQVAETLLEPIRKGFGLSIKVNSGFRGKTLNIRVGGSLTSQHCVGEAVDFNVKGYESRDKQVEIIKWVLANKIKFRQLLLERGCIHISLPHGDEKDGEVAEYVVATKTKTPIKELSV